MSTFALVHYDLERRLAHNDHLKDVGSCHHQGFPCTPWTVTPAQRCQEVGMLGWGSVGLCHQTQVQIPTLHLPPCGCEVLDVSRPCRGLRTRSRKRRDDPGPPLPVGMGLGTARPHPLPQASFPTVSLPKSPAGTAPHVQEENPLLIYWAIWRPPWGPWTSLPSVHVSVSQQRRSPPHWLGRWAAQTLPPLPPGPGMFWPGCGYGLLMPIPSLKMPAPLKEANC